MGGISHALKRSCEALGVEIICHAKARNITVKGGNKVAGVAALVAGERLKIPLRHFYESDIVVAAVDPSIAFDHLLSPSIPGVRRLRDRILARDTKSASMKINCTLSDLPDFRAMPGIQPGPQHCGTIHISPSVQYILDALNMYRKGLHHLSSPVLEITLPSVLDDTLAPLGYHVMNIFVQFYPYVYSHDRLYIGNELPSEEKYFRDVVMPLLREYVSNIDTIITGTQVLTPLYLEKMFGMPGGNIFHGGMGLEQLFSFRPTRGIADYRVREVEGLYLSGAGTHPGGGVTGACGYNAAREILCDIGS
jgi:phytoene dehydrogenase-like protein